MAAPILVRSWNLFHGNASPPGRRSHLASMVGLVCEDGPDAVCLQELPVWALPLLARWSGMRAFPAVARRGLRPPALAGWITRRHNGRLRSAITGQANAILVRPGLEARDLGAVRVGAAGLEPRVCQAVRLTGGIVLGNTHLSNTPVTRGLQERELARAVEFLEASAAPGDVLVLAGDLNMPAPALDGWHVPAASGIDHVLVRGAPAGDLVTWPVERRVQNRVVLSDHAPVELVVG